MLCKWWFTDICSALLHLFLTPGTCPVFFILGRKIMKEQERNQIKTNDIHQTKADLYESLYDAE